MGAASWAGRLFAELMIDSLVALLVGSQSKHSALVLVVRKSFPYSQEAPDNKPTPG